MTALDMTAPGAATLDVEALGVRSVNQRLHAPHEDTGHSGWRLSNPMGAHAIAAGLTQAMDVHIDGHVGYYCAGMNQQAAVTIDGHCGWGVAENMMSGVVRVTGNASQAAAASGHGGLVIIEGDAGHRCGISMKGIDIVVGGSIGHFGAFMAQAGHLVVCGDAGANLGDSIYEAILYVQGSVSSLGADCIEKDMTPEHAETLRRLIASADIDADPSAFRRYGSARRLYNFHVDHAATY
jgi:glutamate synthase domain-containing protein 3